MKKILHLPLAFLLASTPCFAGDKDVDNNGFHDKEFGGTNSNDGTIAGVFVKQADCSTITAGVCLDTDNGNLYVYDGDSVELAGVLSWQGKDADLDYLAGQTLSANVRYLLESANYAAMTGLPYEIPTTYQAVTEATEGTDGNPATMTLTPTAGIGLHIVEITCEDPDGVILTMSEAGAVNLSRVLIIQASTPDISIADSAGVQEMSGTVVLANAGENVTLEYSSALAAWVQVGHPNVLSFSVSEINIQSGTINGAIRPINQTSDTYTLGTNSTADSWGTYFTNTDAAADGAAYTMESAVAGMHFCLENGVGVTEVLSVTPAAGDYLVKNGVRGTAATARASSGAAGDKICVFCQDATDCKITGEVGTWAE